MSLTTEPSSAIPPQLPPDTDREIVNALSNRGLHYGIAPYWTAYRLAFESGESVIVSPPVNDLVRYSPYLDAVRADPAPAYVQLDRDRYRDLQNLLRPPANYAMTRVGNFEVFLPDKP